MIILYILRFNSLQTGKRIQRKREKDRHHNCFKFQFPSNGKAYPKTTEATETDLNTMFQFPSNGKAYPKHRYI